LKTIAVLTLLLVSLAGSLSASELSLARVESPSIEIALPALKIGEAKGSMTKSISVELKYAYARKVKAMGGQAYSLVLTDRPYSEDILKKATILVTQ
jgi:hypothetical protein